MAGLPAVNVDGQRYRSLWPSADGRALNVIDQRWLPHEFRVVTIDSVDGVAAAIREMWVRGAPLIGAAAAYGLAIQALRDASDAAIATARDTLLATRPTAVNLRWALDEMQGALRALPVDARAAAAFSRAARIADDDVAINRRIGDHGVGLIEHIAAAKRPGEPVNVLTHCNAGWLATVDYGTATAPIYRAAERGVPVHVYVDETRPRNQGAHLTAWELAGHGVAHTLIADNAGGHLMQRGAIDLVITGADRVTAGGDVANKIGTYLKALAARDSNVGFYVALPSPTVDWSLVDGADVPIESRDENEVLWVGGRSAEGALTSVSIAPEATPASNPAFDITPARLVTGLITEQGVVDASKQGLAGLLDESAGTGRP